MNKRDSLRKIAFWLACSVALTSHSLAGNPAPKVPVGPTVDFVKADKNNDGRISKSESALVPDLSSAFEMLDVDEDEAISRAEFSQWDRAGKVDEPRPDPATQPTGSAGSQHMPDK
jgi:hypothetical protein